jgi:hypothetical protein
VNIEKNFLPEGHLGARCALRLCSFPSRPLQKFVLVSSALFTIVVHSGLSPTLAGVHPARISVSLSYFMYLLYYRACFWVFHRDGMTLSIQRFQFLCPVFPESRYWTSAILVYTQVLRLFVSSRTALRTLAARQQTLPLPPSPNESWP